MGGGKTKFVGIFAFIGNLPQKLRVLKSLFAYFNEEEMENEWEVMSGEVGHLGVAGNIRSL